MDRQFLEFWGNYLLMVAKGQRQMEDLAEWMQKGFKGFEDLSSVFTKIYGLAAEKTDPKKQADLWQQATAEFQTSLSKWMRLAGWVPADEHHALKQKVTALEKELKAQKQTNHFLRNLLNKGGSPHTEVILGFAELVQKQTREFQELVNGVSQAMDPDQDHPEKTI